MTPLLKADFYDSDSPTPRIYMVQPRYDAQRNLLVPPLFWRVPRLEPIAAIAGYWDDPSASRLVGHIVDTYHLVGPDWITPEAVQMAVDYPHAIYVRLEVAE